MYKLKVGPRGLGVLQLITQGFDLSDIIRSFASIMHIICQLKTRLFKNKNRNMSKCQNIDGNVQGAWSGLGQVRNNSSKNLT